MPVGQSHAGDGRGRPAGVRRPYLHGPVDARPVPGVVRGLRPGPYPWAEGGRAAAAEGMGPHLGLRRRMPEERRTALQGHRSAAAIGGGRRGGGGHEPAGPFST